MESTIYMLVLYRGNGKTGNYYSSLGLGLNPFVALSTVENIVFLGIFAWTLCWDTPPYHPRCQRAAHVAIPTA